MHSALTLKREQGSLFARMALDGIQREYPNKLDHVINGPDDLQSPQALHPAFYGCFDWHSAVHSHWMLVRLLRELPALPEVSEIRTALNENLSKEHLLVETEYLSQPNRRSFERTYGWTWLLKLADELYTWDDPDGQRWSRNLQPLAEVFVQRYLDFLPRQTYPIRTGTHPNTAFGLVFALDYAKTIGHNELESLIVQRSLDYFSRDTDCAASNEPSGADFLSPCLIEAELMRRVLASEEFGPWLNRFLPGLSKGEPRNLFTPATVADRTDPQIVHLDGLNLSRAWCMRNIASALSKNEPVYGVLADAATRHAKAALPHIASGNYMGEHWLASFAALMLSSPALAYNSQI
ncbi:MAG: DUF2891 domain-containing protein [Chloroflexia bacterium]